MLNSRGPPARSEALTYAETNAIEVIRGHVVGQAPSSSACWGAGLGLALSGRLAALMGGRLGHDDNPGGGSVFWLELPLDTAITDNPSGLESADAQLTKLTRLLHVLVVDDVLMNRDIAGSFLRARGHEVTCVESGAEAIAAATSTDFDVILMDVRMPEMDGLEATHRIRALEGARGRVPIVALTAQAFTDQVAACRKAGMDNHLSKPFDPDTLLAAESLTPFQGFILNRRMRCPATAAPVADRSGVSISQTASCGGLIRCDARAAVLAPCRAAQPIPTPWWPIALRSRLPGARAR
jgi:CheY-like chemotaxis protein